jgi:hypothetical protein
VPLFAALDALLGAVGSDIGQCLLVTAWGCLPASQGRAKHDRLIAGAMLGGDAAWLLKRVSEEVTMSALAWAPHTALRQCTMLPWRAWGLTHRPCHHSGD